MERFTDDDFFGYEHRACFVASPGNYLVVPAPPGTLGLGIRIGHRPPPGGPVRRPSASCLLICPSAQYMRRDVQAVGPRDRALLLI
jgi:hypothetical protein